MSSNLFVVGAARSGTTIMTAILNSSDDICLLGEANLHYRWDTKAFVHSFNNQQRQGGRFISRTSYLPKPWIGLTASETLDELRKSFRFVGSKIAFPPFRDMPDSWAQDDAMNFHMQHFYGAQYFFLFREPVACCLSAKKLFSTTSANDIMASWLRSLAFLVLGAQTFPHHRIVPMAWLDTELLRQIETLLETRLHANADWLKEPKTPPATPDTGPGAAFADSLILTPDSTMTGREILEAATELYHRVVGWTDRASLKFRLSDSSIASIEKGVMVTLQYLMSNLSRSDILIRNFFSDPENLAEGSWGRGALSVERCPLEGRDAPPTFILREQNNIQHKNIMQQVPLPVNQPVTFSVEFRPEQRSRFALQIGHSGSPSIATFDLSTCSVTRIHQGPGILALDASCRAAEGGWKSCSFDFMPTVVAESFHIGFYIIDDHGNFDFMGCEDKGVSVRRLKIEAINWPVL